MRPLVVGFTARRLDRRCRYRIFNELALSSGRFDLRVVATPPESVTDRPRLGWLTFAANYIMGASLFLSLKARFEESHVII